MLRTNLRCAKKQRKNGVLIWLSHHQLKIHLEKLDNILSEMESGELTMNESFKKYKEGIELVKKM